MATIIDPQARLSALLEFRNAGSSHFSDMGPCPTLFRYWHQDGRPTAAPSLWVHALARIDAVKPALNAIVRVLADEARAAAALAYRRLRAGETVGRRLREDCALKHEAIEVRLSAHG
jgi:hypothetical protein